MNFKPYAKKKKKKKRGEKFKTVQLDQTKCFRVTTEYECTESDEYSCKCKVLSVEIGPEWADDSVGG